MKLLEGKTPTERNKIIAAGLLGLVALIALYFAFGRSSSTAATSKSSPTPTPKTATGSNAADTSLPPPAEQDFYYQTTPVVYQPGNASAPDAGRNIFAFYEPPRPCPECPQPTPKPTTPKPETPAPTPPVMITSVNPQNVYAGSRGFRLEVTGERFTPDARIYFSQSELPTTFVNAQKLVADIPANFIAQEGPKQIITQTPDGKVYSNQMMLTVQAPPRPTVQYIGMISRKRGNNDTAYFTETEKSAPFGARLNDILGGRFRLVSISPAEVIFQDVDLGFKHHIQLSQQAAVPGGPPGKGGRQPNDGFPQFDPSSIPQSDIPGIPGTIQRYNPSQPSMDSGPQRKGNEKKDVDDNGPD